MFPSSEIPVPSLKLLTPWLDVFPSESVHMSCGMNDSSDWTYTWYKDDERVRTESFFAVDSRGSLFMNSTSAVCSGEYSCKGHLNSRSVSSKSSSGLLLTVYGECLLLKKKVAFTNYCLLIFENLLTLRHETKTDIDAGSRLQSDVP